MHDQAGMEMKYKWVRGKSLFENQIKAVLKTKKPNKYHFDCFPFLVQD